MERKDFLKGLGFLGIGLVAVPMWNACSSDTSSGTDNSGNGNTDACDVTPSETEGPFPTKQPTALVRQDIRLDREGILMAINIAILDANNNDAPLEGAMVDIWHCDAAGNYSEYGGTQMQSENYTSVYFLRGRQTTNADGEVAFTSIFPGWYNGRATHIHVHVYSAGGDSLLVTQIAFPEGSSSAIVAVNATENYGGMSGYTYNSSDNVFSDGVDCELATVTGNVSDGYILDHAIRVSA